MKLLKLRLNLKSLLNYIFVILISSVFVATILIALPLTEEYLNNTPYNLLTKDSSYWSKEYILTLDTKEQKDIEKTRDILFKRLKNFGIEQMSVIQDDGKIKVEITTSKDKDATEQLIKNSFAVQIVTRKNDVNYDDPENPYAYLLATNYNPTDWDGKDFRNIYITKLQNSTGTESYFAIFKLWPTKSVEFNKFLTEHENQTVGVSTDGFVSPVQVPTGTNKLFAAPVSTEDPQDIKIIDILYNSGNIPANISLASEKDMTPNIPQTNYVMVSVLIFAGLLLSYIYLFISKNASSTVLIKSLLATVLTISFYLTILKLLQIPVDTFLLPIEAILAMVLIRVISENKDSVIYVDIILFTVLAILTFLGFGYISIVARDMILLLAISKITLVLSGWYITKVKKI